MGGVNSLFNERSARRIPGVERTGRSRPETHRLLATGSVNTVGFLVPGLLALLTALEMPEKAAV